MWDLVSKLVHGRSQHHSKMIILTKARQAATLAQYECLPLQHYFVRTSEQLDVVLKLTDSVRTE